MFKLPSSKQKKTIPSQSGIKPVALLVLDGWGIAPASDGNAITRAKTPNVDKLYSQFPHGELIASGESVGLPANEVGNSEVGHLTIGIGGVINQSLKRINSAIEDTSFFDNRAFIQTVAHVQKYHSKLHLMGLVSSGSVHASIDHFYALLNFCKDNHVRDVCLHLFTDGRDAPPKEGVRIMEEIEEKIKSIKVGKICTISGRYYAMDRDMRWVRTQKAYEAIVSGVGMKAASAVEAVKAAYAKGQTDEFIEPTVIMKQESFVPETSSIAPVAGSGTINQDNSETLKNQSQANVGGPVGTVDDNDAVIFYNFRVDRPRQLTMAFVLPAFETLQSFEVAGDPHHAQKEGSKVSGPTFKRQKWPKNIFFSTMTEYQKNIKVSAIAYPPLVAVTSLPKVLSERGLKQLHLTESEKLRMITIYFDGLREDRYPGEDVQIIPSPRVETYDKKPEMSVHKVVKELKAAFAKNYYHFFVLNFANPDMVAHSGDVKATIKAIQHVDRAIGEVVKLVLAYDGVLYITADHGNAEELLSFPTASFFFTSAEGKVNTDHSNNPVPFIIISKDLAGKSIKLPPGSLSDVAPTILTKMGLSVPEQMTGRNLLHGT